MMGRTMTGKRRSKEEEGGEEVAAVASAAQGDDIMHLGDDSQRLSEDAFIITLLMLALSRQKENQFFSRFSFPDTKFNLRGSCPLGPTPL